MAFKKFAVQTNPAQQPIRVDASSIEKAREIAEDFFGTIHDAYQLFDWVESPAMLSEVNGWFMNKLDKGFLFDIILNVSDGESFTAEDVKTYAMDNYGLLYSINEIEQAIAELTAMEMIEDDRCDKTIDMFEVAWCALNQLYGH